MSVYLYSVNVLVFLCAHVLQGLKVNMGYLVGDCLLAASFLSYMGPFLSDYRDELLAIWMTQVGQRFPSLLPIKRPKRLFFHVFKCTQVQKLEIPCTPRFNFAVFLSKPTTVRDWNIQGLPSDSFSTENGVIVTRGNRLVAVGADACGGFDTVLNTSFHYSLYPGGR